MIPQPSTSQHTGFSTKLLTRSSSSVFCLLYLIKSLLLAMLCLLSCLSKHWTCTQIFCGASKNQDPTLTMQTSDCPATYKIVKLLMTFVITPFFGLLRKQLSQNLGPKCKVKLRRKLIYKQENKSLQLIYLKKNKTNYILIIM